MNLPHFVRAHHAATIERVVDAFKADEEVRAVIVGGSVAKDEARASSDVDVLLVLSPRRWQEQQREGRVSWVDYALATYEGGYVDFKALDVSFLEAVAERGGEPARNAWVLALPVWCRDEAIPALIERAATYPEEERQSKINSFYAQLLLNQRYFWPEARRMNDAYLLHRAASDLVLFGVRLILAHNRVLFPSHKKLLLALSKAPEKPADLLERAQALLQEPSDENKEAFCDAVLGFTPWNISSDPLSTYVRDSELDWFSNTPSVANN